MHKKYKNHDIGSTTKKKLFQVSGYYRTVDGERQSDEENVQITLSTFKNNLLWHLTITININLDLILCLCVCVCMTDRPLAVKGMIIITIFWYRDGRYCYATTAILAVTLVFRKEISELVLNHFYFNHLNNFFYRINIFSNSIYYKHINLSLKQVFFTSFHSNFGIFGKLPNLPRKNVIY